MFEAFTIDHEVKGRVSLCSLLTLLTLALPKAIKSLFVHPLLDLIGALHMYWYS